MHAHLTHLAGDTLDRLALGAVASCRLAPLTGSAELLLTVWPDEEAASRAAGLAGSGRTFAVEDVHGHPSTRPPAFVSLSEFDGPRDARQVEADRRANRERIWPAASQVPGAVGALVLRAEDGAMVVVAFAEVEQTLAATPPAILSTPLLPGEDPALLGGPDRHGEHRVVDHGVAALLAAGATAGAGR